MAIVRYSGLIDAASGKFGGTVFATSQGRGQIKRLPQRRQETSARGDAARAVWQTCVGAWRDLDSETRLGWNTIAKTWETRNRNGERRALSGRDLFLRMNVIYLRAGIGLRPSVPEYAGIGVLNGVSVDFSASQYLFKWTTRWPAISMLGVFYGGRHMTRGGRRRARPVYLRSAFLTTPPQIDLRSHFVAALGELADGERFTVGYRVGTSNGVVSDVFWIDGFRA